MLKLLLSLLLLLSHQLPIVSCTDDDQVLTSVRLREGSIASQLSGDFRLDVRPLLRRRMSSEDFEQVSRVHFYKEDQAYPFAMDSEGVIFLRGALDREQVCRTGRPGGAIDCGAAGVGDPMDICCLRLRLSVQAGPLIRAFYVRVIVDDVNDSVPSFENSLDQRYYSVSETAPIGYELDMPTATDADSEENGILEYRLMALRPDNETMLRHFQLLGDRPPLLSPRLRLREPLDFEQTAEFAFILAAVDKGSPQLTGTVTLIIEVRDVNDCAPEISDFQPGLIIAVNETNGRYGDQPIANYSVTDADSGENGRVHCFIRSIAPTGSQHKATRYFKVQQKGRSSHQKRTAWELTSQTQLDYEQVKSFSFYIVVTDHGSPRLSSSLSVSIIVLNVDDHPMQISFWSHGGRKQKVEVAENQPSGLEIATVEMRDRDFELPEQYRRVTCQLELAGHERSPDIAAFQLIEKLRFERVKEFHLRTAATFDRESRDVYTVQVTCLDTETGARESAQLLVAVTDQNDCRPEFSRSIYGGRVDENSPRNTPVAMDAGERIRATDRDAFPNNRIVYRLHGNDATGFAINQLGDLMVDGDIDFERQSVYRFNVTAENDNNASMSGTAEVVVNISDLNDNPPIILNHDQGYEFSVQEEVSHVTIGFINATDADYLPENRIVHFRIVPTTLSESHATGMSPDALKYFYIEPLTGRLIVTSPIDRETNRYFRFRVSAENRRRQQPATTAAASPSVAIVRVTVLNINDHPPGLCQRHPVSACVEPRQPIILRFDQAPTTRPVFIDQAVSPADRRCVPFDFRVSDADDDDPTAADGRGDFTIGLANVTEVAHNVWERGVVVSGVEFALEGPQQQRLFCITRLPASGRDRQQFRVGIGLAESGNPGMRRVYECRVFVARTRQPPQDDRPPPPGNGGSVLGNSGVVGLGGVSGGGGGSRGRHNVNQLAGGGSSSGERKHFVVIVTLITVLVFIVVIAFAFVLFFYVKRMDGATIGKDCSRAVPVELQEQTCKLLTQQQQQQQLTATINRCNAGSQLLHSDIADSSPTGGAEFGSDAVSPQVLLHHQPYQHHQVQQLRTPAASRRQLHQLQQRQAPLTGPMSRRSNYWQVYRSANSCEDVSPVLIGYQAVERPRGRLLSANQGYQTLHPPSATSAAAAAGASDSGADVPDSAPPSAVACSPQRLLKGSAYFESSFV